MTKISWLLAGMASAWAGLATAQTACTALNGTTLQLDGIASTVSLTAQDVTGGSYTAPDGEVIAPVPVMCAINAVVSSNANPSQSAIAIAVWLPENSWNGRLLGTGNGGFAGSVAYTTMQLGALEGFAVSNTDMGTGILFGCNTLYCGNDTGRGGPVGGLYGDAAAIEDFGYGATHLMTLAMKELAQDYYQKAGPAYFTGCSTGGQQALMEAQRFPDDYDGILAGAPAHNRTHLHIAGAPVYEATHFAADAYLTTPALTLAHTRVLRACAGTDGGAPQDKFLTQPAACALQASALACHGAPHEVPCTSQTGTCTCLTDDQATALEAYWTGARDTRDRIEYPGAERGTEDPTAAAGLAQFLEVDSEPPFDSLLYWALGPSFQWQSLFHTTSKPAKLLVSQIRAIDDTPVGNSTFAGVLNANSTDLSAFTSRGGKLIVYQGYTDPLIPTATSIDYVNAVRHADPNADQYLRLYLAPGVWHCNGGPGPNAFGNLSPQLPPKLLDPSDDVLGALLAWREAGAAPGPILATKYVNDNQANGIAEQRPLCPYPSHAQWNGGKPTDPASFVCVPGRPIRTQRFSPPYGP